MVYLLTFGLVFVKSEATPGEDEMNPTVKRSGWHPPEDTGLWAIADRVAAEVWSLVYISQHAVAVPHECLLACLRALPCVFKSINVDKHWLQDICASIG